jgi:serine protease inhibitor
MMNRSAKMSYFAGNNFQAVMLPYKDKRLQMCIFLPDKKSNITAFINSLTSESWSEWREQFRKEEGHLRLTSFQS